MGRRVQASRTTRASRRSREAEEEEQDHEEEEDDQEEEDNQEGRAPREDDDDDEEDEEDDGRGQKRKALGLGTWDGGAWEVEAIIEDASKKPRKEGKEADDAEAENDASGDMLSARKLSGLEEADCRKLLSEIMRFILFRNLARKPCRTKDITESVIKPSNIVVSKNNRDVMMNIVKHRFADAFGYRLVSTAHVPNGDKSQDANWFLLSLHESPELRHDKGMGNEGNAERGMAMVILALILLNDGSMAEEKLVEALVQLGVPATSDKAGIGAAQAKARLTFVDAPKAIKQVRDLGFISRKKSGQTNNENVGTFNYHFGPSAKLEIGLPNILRFMEKITGAALQQDDIDKIFKQLQA